jgi:hypothetical protein
LPVATEGNPGGRHPQQRNATPKLSSLLWCQPVCVAISPSVHPNAQDAMWEITLVNAPGSRDVWAVADEIEAP